MMQPTLPNLHDDAGTRAPPDPRRIPRSVTGAPRLRHVSLPYITGDREQLIQAILNIVAQCRPGHAWQVGEIVLPHPGGPAGHPGQEARYKLALAIAGDRQRPRHPGRTSATRSSIRWCRAVKTAAAWACHDGTKFRRAARAYHRRGIRAPAEPAFTVIPATDLERRRMPDVLQIPRAPFSTCIGDHGSLRSQSRFGSRLHFWRPGVNDHECCMDQLMTTARSAGCSRKALDAGGDCHTKSLRLRRPRCWRRWTAAPRSRHRCWCRISGCPAQSALSLLLQGQGAPSRSIPVIIMTAFSDLDSAPCPLSRAGLLNICPSLSTWIRPSNSCVAPSTQSRASDQRAVEELSTVPEILGQGAGHAGGFSRHRAPVAVSCHGAHQR
jgi:hypothetical protein